MKAEEELFYGIYISSYEIIPSAQKLRYTSVPNDMNRISNPRIGCVVSSRSTSKRRRSYGPVTFVYTRELAHLLPTATAVLLYCIDTLIWSTVWCNPRVLSMQEACGMLV